MGFKKRPFLTEGLTEQLEGANQLVLAQPVSLRTMGADIQLPDLGENVQA